MWLLTRLVPVGVALLVAAIGVVSAHLLGPFYGRGDPAYVYLFNSLGLLEGMAPVHIDHPGTTVQELGAMTILVGWLATRLVGVHQSIAESVSSHTEAYLSTINVVLIAINAAVVAFTVRVLIRRTGRVWLCLVVPAILITSKIVMAGWGDVSPEPLLLPISLLMVLLALPSSHSGRRAELMQGAAMGVLLGAGIVTKLTFAPLAFLVLALPGVRAMATALLSALIASLVLTIPIWPQLRAVLGSIVKLATHQGWYGEGPSGLPTIDFLWPRTLYLVYAEPFYLVAIILFAAAALVAWFRVNTVKADGGRGVWARVFLVALAAIICQLLITAIRPLPRYMTPSMGVIAVLAPVAIHLIFRKTATIVGAVLFCGFVAYYNSALWGDLDYGRKGIISAQRLTAEAEQDNCRVLPFFYSNAPEAAANFGLSYTNRAFAPELSKVYPNFISYNLFADHFENFTGANISAEVAVLLESGQKLCLLGTVELKSTAGIDVTPIAQDGIFHLFRVDAVR